MRDQRSEEYDLSLHPPTYRKHFVPPKLPEYYLPPLRVSYYNDAFLGSSNAILANGLSAMFAGDMTPEEAADSIQAAFQSPVKLAHPSVVSKTGE